MQCMGDLVGNGHNVSMCTKRRACLRLAGDHSKTRARMARARARGHTTIPSAT